MQYHKQLAIFLKNKRLKTKKSLNVFAQECNIEPSTLSRIENGLLELKLSILVKLALNFNSTPSVLLAEFEDYLLKNKK